jgi:ABC-type Fe3+-hydroxamate transport system substrate-binding protein
MSSPTPRPPLGEFVDAVGVGHARASGEVRIVSLVPSLTELLCDLGLGSVIVGRTGFCIHPREVVKAIPKVGGTKDVNIDKVRALAPTHLVVNIDENEKPTVEKLARFVPHVVVTHPIDPMDNIGLYRLLGGIFGRQQEAESLCAAFLAAWHELELAARAWPRERVLYLIWKAPWMTVSRDTYISHTLGLARWDTVPEQASVRYPKISLTPQLIAESDRVLLSSEPYSFRERHVEELRTLCPAKVGIHLVKGEMISWYGSRAITGLRYLMALRARSLVS